QLPLVHLLRAGVEATQHAPRVIAVPDRPIARDRHAARSRVAARQRVLAQLERRRVDGPDLVGAEFDEPGPAGWVQSDAIRPRPRRAHRDQPNLARRHSQLADEVAALHGEPDVAVTVPDHGVWVARRGVRHREALDAAVLRTEPPDVRRCVTGVPSGTGALAYT